MTDPNTVRFTQENSSTSFDLPRDTLGKLAFMALSEGKSTGEIMAAVLEQFVSGPEYEEFAERWREWAKSKRREWDDNMFQEMIENMQQLPPDTQA